MLRQIISRSATAATRRVAAAPACRPSFSVNTARFLTTEASETPSTPTPEPILSSSEPPKTATTDSAIPSAGSKSARTRSRVARTPIEEPKPRQLTYLVERTKAKQLPVYDDVKSGGTRKFTIIRKIVGNAQDMKTDLINEMRFKKDDVNVNPVTGNVSIKGYHQAAIKLWLEARGM